MGRFRHEERVCVVRLSPKVKKNKKKWESDSLDLCQWESDVSLKSLNSEDPRRIFQNKLAIRPNLKTECSQLLEKPEKGNSGADVGTRSP